MALDYENIILISHEDTSKDITKKGGDKITAIKPNMQDKVALKVAGMVDIVARIVADGDVRTFNFKSNEVIFGGGRLKTDAKDIPLDVNALFAVYDEANRNAVKMAQNGTQQAESNQTVNNTPSDEKPSDKPTEGKETVRKSRRKVADKPEEPALANWTPGGGNVDDSAPVDDEPPFDTNAEPEAPAEEVKPRKRKSRRNSTTENN
jgi:hypothetical protein